MKSTLMKVSFNGGELSPLLDGRVDYPKYTSGCKEMTNFIPTVYGPITKRPGTRFVEDIGGESYLYPFEFSESQAYIFAFTSTSIEVFTGDGRLLDGGNNPVSLSNPYTLQESKELKFAQTGDLVYFTHPTGGMVKISRTDVDAFTVESFSPVNGPFQDENTEDISFTLSGTTITSSVSVFNSGHVGSLIKIGYVPSTEFDSWVPAEGSWAVNDYLQYQGRIYQVTAGTGVAGKRSPLHEMGEKSDGNLTLLYVSDGYGYAKVTNYVSPTEVTVSIVKDFPPNIDGTPRFEWSWGAFGGSFGWPSAIVFHQQRMVLGGSLEQPQTIWGSTQTDIESFEEGTEDDESYEFTIAANKKNPISWLTSNVILHIGTTGGEFFASSTGSSITPNDIDVQQIGTYGSNNSAPLIANGFTVFAQAGGRKLRELRYQDETQRNFARDLNKVAEHIADAGITQISYQAEPYQIIWVVIGGELYALTYESDEDVFAWSRQSVGNVISIATIPNLGNDRLWMVVSRSGGYYIEYLTKFFRTNDSIDNSCFVDSSLVYEGAETFTLTGLDHLEGETVSILNEGSVGPQKQVVGGQIELQYATTKCTVGLPIKSSWQSMRFEGGSNDGVGQGKSKRVNEVIFRLINTGSGLKYGKGNLNLSFENDLFAYIPIRSTNDDMDGPPSLFNGDTWRQPTEGGTDTQYMARVEHEDPVPCTIISIIFGVDTNQ